MTPEWWGIVAIVAIGGAVVLYGWASDSRRQRAAERAASEPPKREIPGLRAHATPDYLPQLPPDAAPIDLDATDADALARRDEAGTLPAGAADGRFLNRPRRGLAVLHHPHVVVLADPLHDERPLHTLLVAAKRLGRPLVVVAPDFTDAVLNTLSANAAHGTLPNLVVQLADAAARRKAVALTGGRLVSASDLASDWLPATHWGTCTAWVADLDDSWVITDADPSTSPSEP